MKPIKKPLLAALALTLLLHSNMAQAANMVGDYQTVPGAFFFGNWSALGSWQRWTGAAWATPTAGQGYPGQFATPNTVTFNNTLSILTLDVTPAFSINNLILANSGISLLNTSGNPSITVNTLMQLTSGSDFFTFAGSGNLTVSGTTSVTGGTFTDSGTGTATFVGLVTITGGGTFTSTAVTTTANMIFRGGIANSATFTAGGATFDTNSQAISGTGSLSFGNNVAINAITLTNSNTGNLTITGTTTGTGSFTDSNNSGVDTFTGNVALTGAFLTTAVTTTANLVFQGGITNSGTSFSAGGATFDTNSQILSGTTATSFANNIAINGITLTNSNTGNLLVTGTTTLTGGGFTDTDNTSSDIFVGNVSQTGASAFNTTAVTTNGNLIFRGGITNSGGTFTAGAGNFDTNNQALAGTADISFANFVIVTGITVTNNNTLSVSLTRIAGAVTLSGTGTWTQGANSTLNYTGTSITLTTFNASNSGNTVNYNSVTSAQTIRDPTASTYFNLTLSGTGNQTKTLSANEIVSGNLSIQNTAIFSVSTFSLSVAGNWTNSSTNADPFVEGAQTVTFNGSTAAQTLSNTGNANGTVFNSVTFFNTFGTSPQFTLSGNNMVVASTLTMTQGNCNLNSLNLTIGTAAASPGSLVHSLASTAGWVYGGNLVRFFTTGTIANGSVTGFFPMGNSANFRPFFLSCPATGITTGGSFTLSVGAAVTTTVVSIPDTNPVATIVLQYQGSWTVSAAGVAGGTYNLVAGGTGFGTIGSLNDVRLCKSASVVGTNAVATNTTADPRLNRTGLLLSDITTTGGNQFFLGSTNAVSSPLPIELVSFVGVAKKTGVDLTWETASETDNDFFTVLRSISETDFEPVGTVKGNGTTNAQHEYRLTDYQPAIGKNYYLLKQTDFDGHSTIQATIVVDVPSLDPLVTIYPNPIAQNALLYIMVKGLQPNSPTEIQIINMQGNKVNEATRNTDLDGTLKASIDLTNLSPGLYVVRLQKINFKFVKE